MSEGVRLSTGKRPPDLGMPGPEVRTCPRGLAMTCWGSSPFPPPTPRSRDCPLSTRPAPPSAPSLAQRPWSCSLQQPALVQRLCLGRDTPPHVTSAHSSPARKTGQENERVTCQHFCSVTPVGAPSLGAGERQGGHLGDGDLACSLEPRGAARPGLAVTSLETCRPPCSASFLGEPSLPTEFASPPRARLVPSVWPEELPGSAEAWVAEGCLPRLTALSPQGAYPVGGKEDGSVGDSGEWVGRARVWVVSAPPQPLPGPV